MLPDRRLVCLSKHARSCLLGRFVSRTLGWVVPSFCCFSLSFCLPFFNALIVQILSSVLTIAGRTFVVIPIHSTFFVPPKTSSSDKTTVDMEKFTDTSPISPEDPSPDYESSSLLNTHYIKQDAHRRRNYIYLTLFNLFIFTLSMLSLICAVMSQKDSSGNSAAKLMDEFGITCKSIHLLVVSLQEGKV
jgi:hypothetical protein